MELSFNKKKNQEERIRFIRDYAAWVKKVPNEVWSKQQAALIDSFMENCKNFGMSREKYLKMMDKSERRRLFHKS
jgi:secreted Zn-dependent insulinase-like peptidase